MALTTPEELVAHLERGGIRDPGVLRAFRTVPRESFIPAEWRDAAWQDEALPIGLGQTISQPTVVALTLEALHLRGDERLLEIGTGSGYQTALLTTLCAEVWTIEVLEPLAGAARHRLARMGFDRCVHARIGDGRLGWSEAAPFGAIIVSAATSRIPPPLLDQLAPGGRLIVPLGGPGHQDLIEVSKGQDGVFSSRTLLPALLVPLVALDPAPSGA